MRYSRPQLYSLTDRDSRGNCANGSAAGSVSDTCTTGTGINSSGSGHYCADGAGDGSWCHTGTAAFRGTAYCGTGTGPDSTCGTGGTPFP